jgi:plasmid stability protein
MATNKPQDDYKKTALRLPQDLHEQLHEAAAASGRSYNAEIVNRLQESLDGKAVVLPDGIREELLARSKSNGWPFESELIHTLVDALTPPEDLLPQATGLSLSVVAKLSLVIELDKKVRQLSDAVHYVREGQNTAPTEAILQNTKILLRQLEDDIENELGYFPFEKRWRPR